MRAYLSSWLSKLLAGELAAFGGPATDETVAGYIRAEQVSLVLGYSLGIMMANACQCDRTRHCALAFARQKRCPDLGGDCRLRRAIDRPESAFITTDDEAPVRVAPGHAPVGTECAGSRNCLGNCAGGFLRECLQWRAARHNVSLLWNACRWRIRLRHDSGGGSCVHGSDLCGYRNLPRQKRRFRLSARRYSGRGLWLRTPAGVFANSFAFTRRTIAQLEAERRGRRDPLTQLPNRFAFNECLEGALNRLARTGEEFAVLLLDLDRFKEVNDKFGHPAGDDFLVQTAARLQRCVRQTDTVARIGGDEFAIVMTNLTKVEDAFEVAERFVGAFAEPFAIEKCEIAGATSIGIAMAPRDGDVPHELLRNADIALYRAKQAGPGTICFYEISDDKSAHEHRALQQDLELAIDRDELFLLYQPFFDIRTDRVTGFEALLRWRHPVRGVISPTEFIPIAEETGLIHGIGEWVVRRACATLSNWPSDLRIAVNFSAAQFHNVSILETIVQALSQARVAPHRLEIEITESMLISKYAPASSILNALLQLGVTVALDDFGTGYSSLTYLLKLPYTRIKIDQSFIRDMLSRPESAAIVKSIITLTQDRQIGVVAEGVETAEQLDYLRKANCDEVQGYLIGRPVAADEIFALLDQDKRWSTPAA
ncbi:diguanylate cyclase (GGDEF)-like protein [Bradyrhizobium sp. USDA 4504]